MHHLPKSILILFAALAAGGGAIAAEPTARGPKISAETIGKWIEQLDSDMYIARERATIALEGVGEAAIGALAEAADGDRPEVGIRAVRVLVKYSEDKDAKLSLAALKTIASLKNRPAERSAAEVILAAKREKQALVEVLRLGGAKDDRFLDGFGPDIHLKLGDKWTGGDEGMRHVGDLQELLTLSIHDTPVTDKGLEHLTKLKKLTNIVLFGTNVTAAGVESLRRAMPQALVDHHRVFLGVRARRLPQPIAQITNVVAGSTAEKAGIRANDVITKFDGKPVTDFLSLTNHIATCKPGDKVIVELKRGTEVLTLEVTFGSGP